MTINVGYTHVFSLSSGADVVLNVGCNDWKAFLPVERHRVSVTVAEERAL